MDKLKSLGDEDLRQQHEEKLRDIFKEHNISEEKGFFYSFRFISTER